MNERISFNVELNFVTRLVDIKGSEANDESKKVMNIVRFIDLRKCFLFNCGSVCVFEEFQIDPTEYVSFGFENNHHAPVDIEQIPWLIKQHKTSSFYIEILLEEPSLPLKTEVIQSYFKTDTMIITSYFPKVN